MKNIKKITLITFLMILVITGCTKKDNIEKKDEAVNVKTEKVVEKSYTPTLNFSGTIKANKEANLGASLPGRVEKFYVKEGETVEEGQLIAQLSDELYTLSEIEYKAIEKDFGRISQLYSKGSVSEMEYDHLKAKLDASKEKYNLLKKNTQIIAPFSGIVTEILVNEGENFSIMPALDLGYSHASGIVRLMQINTVKAEIQVNEKDITQIRKGQKTELNCDSFPEESFTGYITNIQSLLSNLSRTTTVEISIANPQKKLLPGMFIRSKISLQTTKGIFIPRVALLKQSGTNETYVYCFENGVAVKKNIQIIKSIKDEVIVEGLTIDEEVITSGKTKIKDGQAVIIDGGQK